MTLHKLDEASALYILSVLWSIAGVSCASWCASCWLCCVPKRLRRACFAIGLVALAAALVSSALFTHHLASAFSETRTVVVKAYRIGELLASDER